jgi:hypothetical protein
MSITDVGLLERVEAGTALWKYTYGLSRGNSLVVLTSEDRLPSHRFNAWVVGSTGSDLTRSVIECGTLNDIVAGKNKGEDMWLDGRNEVIQDVRLRLIKYFDEE